MKEIPFRETLDSLPVAIYITDAEGRLTYFNEAAVQFSGRVPQLGTDQWCVTWKLYNPDGTRLPHDQCPMAVAMKEARPVLGAEAIAERPDGKRLWFTPFPAPIFDAEGNVAGGMNMLVDITERKAREHADAWLSAIIQNSDDAIISKNLNGIITSWNESAQHMFGYTAEEMIGKPVTTLIPEERLKEEKMILEQLKQGNRIHHFETVRLRKDGTPIDISLRVSPIQNSEGKVIGASKIARDITEKKRAEAKLKSMNDTLESRVKDRTAALLSYQEQLRSLTAKLSRAEEGERQRLATELHDNLGQILTMGKMKLDLLLNGPLPEQIYEQAVEMGDLMNEAITYTRELMSELKPPPSLEKENLETHIQWVINNMKKHDLEVQLEQDEHPKPLTEEVRQSLCQCVRELLFNVIKHAGVKKARVSLSRKGNRVEVTVEDEGQGFDTSEKTGPSQKGGFGLFSISERMDWFEGSMNIDSRPGKGTTVKLIVPVQDESVAEIHPINENVKESNTNGKAAESPPVRILLVDDHEMVRSGLRAMLETQDDFQVIAEMGSDREAVRKALAHSPDVILVDISMPEMKGLEIIRQICSGNAASSIIGLSAQSKKNVGDAVKRAGASAFLTKFEAFESLAAVIRSEVRVINEAAGK